MHLLQKKTINEFDVPKRTYTYSEETSSLHATLFNRIIVSPKMSRIDSRQACMQTFTARTDRSTQCPTPQSLAAVTGGLTTSLDVSPPVSKLVISDTVTTLANLNILWTDDKD